MKDVLSLKRWNNFSVSGRKSLPQVHHTPDVILGSLFTFLSSIFLLVNVGKPHLTHRVVAVKLGRGC